MAEQRNTIFQDLGNALVFGFDKNVEKQQKKVNSYTINSNDVIIKTKDKAEFEKTKAQIKQEKYLASQWFSAGLNLSQTKTKLLAIIANERGAKEACQFEQISYLGYPFSISETITLDSVDPALILLLKTSLPLKLKIFIVSLFFNDSNFT
jgi:hypothetical protein